MLIQKETSTSKISIKGYTPGSINVMGKEFEHPILLTADSLESFDETTNFLDLTKEQLESLVKKDTELLILGSGENHHFLSPKETASLIEKGIAVESMSTRNACHTFQVLTYENRRVVALLFP